MLVQAKDFQLTCMSNFMAYLLLLISNNYYLMWQTIALVGESGCGKSTAISLLQRFYDPDSGQIILDGVEIQKLQLRWLRQQMGLVSQEPVLFNDTIRANVSYGKEGGATEAEILAAAEFANAHKFISSLQQVGGMPLPYNCYLIIYFKWSFSFKSQHKQVDS